MAKKDITAGETLSTFLKRNILSSPIWRKLEAAIEPCGRGVHWSQFLEEVIATQLTGRLVTAGSSIAESLGGKPGISELEFAQKMNAIISDTTQGSLDKRQRQLLLNYTSKAVQATFGNLTEADSRIIYKEAGKPPKCFLCNRKLVMVRGSSLKELSDEDRSRAVEEEHIWPRSYGGDTVAENLALACHRCNQHKDSFACWAMVGIQSLVRGLPKSPGPESEDVPKSLSTIAGWHRFAIVSRTAHMIADRDSLTLKQAYFEIRSGILPHPKVRQPDDVADFFNLTSHAEAY